MMIDNIIPILGDKTLEQAAIDGDITIHNLDSTPKPAQRPKTTPKWTGPDSVLSYGPDVEAPKIEYDKPPENRYGEPIEVIIV